MAKQIEGVYEEVLKYAEIEFLEKGFIDASLRTIANNAKTSTGSIYTRFKDKEGLFKAIVNPAAEGLKKRFLQAQEDFCEKEVQEQIADMSDYSLAALLSIIDYIYENFTKFDLLVNASYGTEFSDFLNELVEIEAEYSCKYMERIGCNQVEDGMITEDILHIITTAYMNGIFEVVRHKMPLEEAKKYVRIMFLYHRRGYDVIFEELKGNQ